MSFTISFFITIISFQSSGIASGDINYGDDEKDNVDSFEEEMGKKDAKKNGKKKRVGSMEKDIEKGSWRKKSTWEKFGSQEEDGSWEKNSSWEEDSSRKENGSWEENDFREKSAFLNCFRKEDGSKVEFAIVWCLGSEDNNREFEAIT